MQHPVTDENKRSGKQIIETLKAVSKINKPVIWFWPNVDIGTDGISTNLRIFREKNKIKEFSLYKKYEPI